MFVLLCLSYFIFSYSAIFAASVIKRSVQFSSVQFSSVYLGSWRQNTKIRFSQKLSNLELWCPLTTYRKSAPCDIYLKVRHMRFSPLTYLLGLFKEPIIGSLKSKMANRQDVIFSAEDFPIWIAFRRLVHNDMSTAVIWSKLKPDGERLGEFHGMSSQSHQPHCRMQSPGEINVMIVPYLQGVIIPSAILKIVFRYILFYFF